MQHLNNPFFKEFGVINIISTTHSHFYDILNKICSGSLKTGYRWPTLFIYVPHRACSQDIKGSSKCRPTSWHAQVRLLIPNVDTSVFFVMGSNRTISGLLLVLRTSIPFSKSLWVRTVAGAYHGHCWAKAWEQKYKINFFLSIELVSIPISWVHQFSVNFSIPVQTQTEENSISLNFCFYNLSQGLFSAYV